MFTLNSVVSVAKLDSFFFKGKYRVEGRVYTGILIGITQQVDKETEYLVKVGDEKIVTTELFEYEFQAADVIKSRILDIETVYVRKPQSAVKEEDMNIEDLPF